MLLSHISDRCFSLHTVTFGVPLQIGKDGGDLCEVRYMQDPVCLNHQVWATTEFIKILDANLCCRRKVETLLKVVVLKNMPLPSRGI